MNEQEERKFIQAVMALECGWCKAKPGEPCRTPSGRKSVSPRWHEARLTPVQIAYRREQDRKNGIQKCPMCDGRGRIKVTHE